MGAAATEITDTVRSLLLVTYTWVPSGLNATPAGPAPTGMVAMTVLEAVRNNA